MNTKDLLNELKSSESRSEYEKILDDYIVSVVPDKYKTYEWGRSEPDYVGSEQLNYQFIPITDQVRWITTNMNFVTGKTRVLKFKSRRIIMNALNGFIKIQINTEDLQYDDILVKILNIDQDDYTNGGVKSGYFNEVVMSMTNNHTWELVDLVTDEESFIRSILSLIQ